MAPLRQRAAACHLPPDRILGGHPLTHLQPVGSGDGHGTFGHNRRWSFDLLLAVGGVAISFEPYGSSAGGPLQQRLQPDCYLSIAVHGDQVDAIERL
jgi:hypothetical protein